MAKGLDGLVGLAVEKQRAKICIKAAKVSGEVCGHVLLHGVGGVGKTAVARAMAHDLGYLFIEREAAAFRHRDDIADLLQECDKQARTAGKPFLLFVDEVHRLALNLQEAFYYPMKEWTINLTKGAYTMRPFCLVAATTRRDLLDEASFVKRFDNVWEIERYEDTYICDILADVLRANGIGFTPNQLQYIAVRCFGIPRQACTLAGKIRNYILARGGTRTMQSSDIDDTFAMEGMDDKGLNKQHIRYMRELFLAEGVHKGLAFLAGRLGQQEDVVAGYIEPTLLELGFIDRDRRGRILTKAGLDHLRQCHHIVSAKKGEANV